jgi:RNA polymerase sigma-70 factor (ECF subfamily)
MPAPRSSRALAPLPCGDPLAGRDPGRAVGAAESGTTSHRLRALVDGHFAFVGRLVRHLGAPEADVDDVLQRVFTSAAARLHDIAEGSERAFLVQAAVRWAANARRARARTSAHEVCCDDLPEVADRGPSAESLVERRHAVAVLDGLLATMALELRTVFVLDEIEEMSRAEIAEVLGLPEGTVASRLRRARQDFEARLARWKRGAKLTGGVP